MVRSVERTRRVDRTSFGPASPGPQHSLPGASDAESGERRDRQRERRHEPGGRGRGTVEKGTQNRQVVTGDGVLWLEEVQVAGKRALPIEAPGGVGLRGEPVRVGRKAFRPA
jgi:hypothetical protein